MYSQKPQQTRRGLPPAKRYEHCPEWLWRSLTSPSVCALTSRCQANSGPSPSPQSPPSLSVFFLCRSQQPGTHPIQEFHHQYISLVFCCISGAADTLPIGQLSASPHWSLTANLQCRPPSPMQLSISTVTKYGFSLLYVLNTVNISASLPSLSSSTFFTVPLSSFFFSFYPVSVSLSLRNCLHCLCMWPLAWHSQHSMSLSCFPLVTRLTPSSSVVTFSMLSTTLE